MNDSKSALPHSKYVHTLFVVFLFQFFAGQKWPFRKTNYFIVTLYLSFYSRIQDPKLEGHVSTANNVLLYL